jgi:nicotinamidase-related amidase
MQVLRAASADTASAQKQRKFGVVVIDVEEHITGHLPLRKGLTLADGIAQIVGVIQEARRNGCPVHIFKDGDYQVHPEIIEAAVAAHVFRKTGLSPFGEIRTDEITLFDLLRADAVTDVVLVGASARYCVRAGAKDAIGFGFRVHTSPDTLLASEVDIELKTREMMEFYSSQTIFHANARLMMGAIVESNRVVPVYFSPQLPQASLSCP